VQFSKLTEEDTNSVLNEMHNLWRFFTSLLTIDKQLIPSAFVTWDDLANLKWRKDIESAIQALKSLRPEVPATVAITTSTSTTSTTTTTTTTTVTTTTITTVTSAAITTSIITTQYYYYYHYPHLVLGVGSTQCSRCKADAGLCNGLAGGGLQSYSAARVLHHGAAADKC
jgi:hypothetical protein